LGIRHPAGRQSGRIRSHSTRSGRRKPPRYRSGLRSSLRTLTARQPLARDAFHLMASAGSVLIVDDDVSVGNAFRRLLVLAGFDVQVFTSGSDFLRRGPDASPSCVILDQCMPDLSGLELQRLISGEQVLSVILITGHGDVSTSVEAMKRGAIDFL